LDTPPLSNRSRRALPLIAAALTAIVVAGLLYLRPSLPSAPLPSAHASPEPRVLEQRYQADYDFVTPSLGWALVYDLISGRYWVSNTTDGARHWDLQKSDLQPINASFRVRFFNAHDGFYSLAGGGTFRTSDGGRHWNQVTLPSTTIGAVWFVDLAHGWYQSDSDFESTSDGGTSWHALPPPPLAGPLLDFADARNGWLASIADAAPAVVYSTNDGGASWTAHALPGEAGGKPFRPADGLSALPGGGVLVDLLDETAFTSFDGGATWSKLAPPPSGNRYQDISIQDATHWWAMRLGDLFKTSDAGQSWQHVAIQLDGWLYLPGILDARHAWAKLESSGPPTSGSSFAMTSDGGVHWTYLSVPRVS